MYNEHICNNIISNFEEHDVTYSCAQLHYCKDRDAWENVTFGARDKGFQTFLAANLTLKLIEGHHNWYALKAHARVHLITELDYHIEREISLQLLSNALWHVYKYVSRNEWLKEWKIS